MLKQYMPKELYNINQYKQIVQLHVMFNIRKCEMLIRWANFNTEKV